MVDSPMLTIRQVAERTGLTAHSLRFYEREGLVLNPITRDGSGRRVYGEDDVSWLTLCVVLRVSGMPVADIREYTKLFRAGRGNEGRRLELLRQQRERVLHQQEELQRSLDVIDYKIGAYEDALGPPANS